MGCLRLAHGTGNGVHFEASGFRVLVNSQIEVNLDDMMKHTEDTVSSHPT